jgi:riboflavin synthase
MHSKCVKKEGLVFTGIIEELGKIQTLEKRGNGARIKISAKIVTKDSLEGDSIAVNGVCLTALDIKPDSFAADVSQETLNRSTLGNLQTSSVVNLERAVTPSTRLGGHIVQGHVDARGKFIEAIQNGDFWRVRINFPREIGQYLVYKGSISVEGISLTIADLTDDQFEIAVIPKTWELTNLSALKPGDEVNLETDVIAKYVERIMLYREQKAEGITIEKLKNLGFA